MSRTRKSPFPSGPTVFMKKSAFSRRKRGALFKKHTYTCEITSENFTYLGAGGQVRVPKTVCTCQKVEESVCV